MNMLFPKNLVPKEIGNLENDRIVRADNDRLLLCGRIIIQLSIDQQEILDVGIILAEKDYSMVKFTFMSLLKDDERKLIWAKVKNPKEVKQIVEFDFDQQPFSPYENIDKIYFIHHLENEDCDIYGTSIVKLSSETLKCFEIYQSKYKIEHFSMNENIDFAKMQSK